MPRPSASLLARSHQAFVDEPIDAAGHSRARAVGPSRELAHAQFPARLAELSQDIEIAQGEPDLVDEIRCELAHQRRVGTHQRLPGTQARARSGSPRR